MNNLTKTILAGAVLVGVGAPANAGPNFIEGLDAGSTPGSATHITGGGALASIAGNTSIPFGPIAPDFEDMYLIFIKDAAAFTATTEDPATTFDTQLWLFRFDETDPLMHGLGLLGNNDTSAIDDASMLGPFSDDGTGVVITDGLYYLAISGGPGLGVMDPGRFPVAGVSAIFDLVTPTEISGPDGSGGASVIDDWLGEGGVGNYVIHLTGVSFVPAPGAVVVLVLGLFGRGARSRR